jgi:hypothetical protein
LTSKERVLERERQRGYAAAHEVQEKSPNMTGTELYVAADRIPRFAEACKRKNMLERPIGFVCKSTAGRVVKLIQPYDSNIFTQEPEELVAQWGFKWSTDPAHAQPFVSASTSPYNKGECCKENERVYRSVIDGNVWAPSAYPSGWEAVM